MEESKWAMMSSYFFKLVSCTSFKKILDCLDVIIVVARDDGWEVAVEQEVAVAFFSSAMDLSSTWSYSIGI